MIETRSGEFARSEAPAPSPEQRLLIDPGEGAETADGAAQRLAGKGDASTIEEQSVAAVALRQAADAGRPAEPAGAEASALSADTQAFINALVGTVAGTPPQP